MPRLMKRLFRALLIAALAAIVLTFVQALLLRWFDPKTTAWMRMREREAHAEGRAYTIRHTWVPLERIPRRVQRAVIEAEDGRFYQHHGFDWDAIRAARARNDRAERIKRGGSTITQQLAKNLYLDGSRTYIRKGREAVITVAMELLLPKQRILELYLNSIEWGPGVFGIEEAARYHFGEDAWQLSLGQACRLASIIPAPLRYRINGEYVDRRADELERLIEGGG